jgi:threonine synthase
LFFYKKYQSGGLIHDMNLCSTRRQAPVVTFREALFAGQAPDGGLYMPTTFPKLTTDELASLSDFRQLATAVLQQLLGDEFSSRGLESVVKQAYPFDPALTEIDESTSVLELFHGPTLSFKDFGAQFMAKSMAWFLRDENREITILVATSGDTGSAVAHAYHRVEGIRIVLLYPSVKVSALQEKQFTTLGDNVFALEVDGTFDDCQSLVKSAFRDRDLTEKARLSSANSINIGRLIPQALYYFWGVLTINARSGHYPLVCVPSGNFGNLCAGLFAGLWGLPVAQYIAAVNANSVIPDYLQTGVYQPRPSLHTLSNAMDVGNPSNWERIQTLFDNDHNRIRQKLWSTSISDAETLETMRTTHQLGYVADPHTAVGLAAAARFRQENRAAQPQPMLVLSTAHPAKFPEVIQQALGIEIPLPQILQESLKKEKKATRLANSYHDLKEFIWRL